MLKGSVVLLILIIFLSSLLLPSQSTAQYISKRITQADAISDVHQFFSTLQRVHPDLLAKVDVNEYIKLKQQTLDNISKNLDSEGKIDIDILAQLLCYAAAFFKDGHTLVNWWEIRTNESNTRFPSFILQYDNGHFFINTSKNKNIEGLEVVSVNGKPIMKFLSPILDLESGETIAFKAGSFSYYQSFWYCFSKLCSSAKSLDLELRDDKGKKIEQSVETVGFIDFNKLGSDIHASKIKELRGKGTTLHFLDSGRVAYLVYPAFQYSENEKKKIDSIFEVVKSKKSQDLIIDIRGNGGGNSSMGDFVFAYLHKGKFIQFSKVRIKASHDVLLSKDKDLEIPDDVNINGLIVTMPIKEKSVQKPNAFFSGRIFLLVDNVTFSSAVSFAAMFRDYNIGKILGYETGGLPICSGDVYQFKLDNSAIPCSVSCAQVFPPKPRLGDDEHGIIPDIRMTSEKLRPYQKKDDPILAYTLDHIKNTRKSH